MSSVLIIVVLLWAAHRTVLLYTTRGKHIKHAALPEPSRIIHHVRSTVTKPSSPPSPALEPYQLPPLQERTGPAHPGMGLKRLDAGNWLTVDKDYVLEHTLRASLLTKDHSRVIQCLPGSEEACHEVLEGVVSFLTSRFPQHFSLAPWRLPFLACRFQNHLTGETFIVGSSCPNPLETAARLAMEDFNILMKHPKTGEYSLMASATLYPTGWKLQERIGSSMMNLHTPVPGWKENLSAHVARYFDHINPRTMMERGNLFIQTSPDLFQDVPETPRPLSQPLRPEQCMVRRERQTFSRLEKSNAILFTVRTFMKPLSRLGKDETKALLSQIRGWDEIVRRYKGWSVWGSVVEEWCLEKLREDEKGRELH